MTESELLARIAQAPFDRRLRLVFADWLLEQGDPRGDVIALESRGLLTSAERRKQERVVATHGARWLGPLEPHAESFRFEGGFLSDVMLERITEGLVGDPRLATVRTLALKESAPAPGLLAKFLGHPVLGAVQTFEAHASALLRLGKTRPGFKAQVLGVRLVHLADELSAVAALTGFKSAKRLAMITQDFLNNDLADELHSSVFDAPWLERLDALELRANQGSIEGVARWLLDAVTDARSRQWLQRGGEWRAVQADVRFILRGDGEGRQLLEIDVGQAEGEMTGGRLAAAASLLALMNGAELAGAEVKAPGSRKISRGELDALRAAARRLRGLSTLVVGANRYVP